MKEKSFLNGSDGMKLHYELSSGQISFPDTVIIHCHGLTSTMSSNNNNYLKEYFQNRGFVTLGFDFFGHGQSDGAFADMTISKCVKNLQDIFQFCLQEKGFKRIGLIGSSFGGLISLLAVSQKPDIIRVIGLISPVVRPLILAQLIADRYNITIEEWRECSSSENSEFRLQYSFYEDASRISFNPGAISVPVITAHGIDDHVVSVGESEYLFWNLKNCFMLKAKNISHGFQDNSEYKSLLNAIGQFVVDQIIGKME